MTSWDRAALTDMAAALCVASGLDAPLRWTSIRVWDLSGVERLHLPDQTSVIFKFATDPFTTEDDALRAAARANLPVPTVYASARTEGLLGMILEDLGDPVRDATDRDAAIAAARMHRAEISAAGSRVPLATWGERQLAAMPDAALQSLDTLRADGRFPRTDDVATMLTTLAAAGPSRAAGAERPPFGVVHGELHPTSLHIGVSGWRLLDLAKTFVGPGSLDLATWQGTRNPLDPDRLGEQLHAYVAAGGDADILATRGGLSAEPWALGWHRVWAAHWFLHQSVHGSTGTATDDETAAIIRRQLSAAVELLRP